MESQGSVVQYVTFCLGDELFGVEVQRAREILNLCPMTEVPQTPDFMLGVINLRGQVVPVIDMRLKLNIDAGENTQDTCIIVVEILVDDEPIIVGLFADAVREVIDILNSQIEPPPKLGAKINTEFIKGMGNIDGQFLILLDIDKVFNAGEAELVAVFSEETEIIDEQEFIEA